MKKLTLDYLKGIVDALYYSQIELLGSEIEEEKEFDMNAFLLGNDFEIHLTSIVGFKDSKLESDDHIPVKSNQIIYIKQDTKVNKIIKDVITEMEVIYNQPIPEMVEA